MRLGVYSAVHHRQSRGAAVLATILIAFLGVSVYGGMSNWMYQPWRFSIMSVLDRVVGYALIGIALHLCLPAAG